MSAPKTNRKLHRIGALISALPLLVILISGLLLQLKKQVDWIQPPTQRGSSEAPGLDFEGILELTRAVPEAQVQDWADIDRLDVRPERGIVKVRCKNRWEVQFDSASGEILSSTYRRSDLIESFHDGSWFGDGVKLYLFLPVGVISARAVGHRGVPVAASISASAPAQGLMRLNRANRLFITRRSVAGRLSAPHR